MDETLRQLLTGMFRLSQENDQLRARVQQLEQQVEQKTRAEEQQELAALWTGPPAKD